VAEAPLEDRLPAGLDPKPEKPAALFDVVPKKAVPAVLLDPGAPKEGDAVLLEFPNPPKAVG